MLLLVFKASDFTVLLWAIINTNRSPYKQQTGEESCQSLDKFLRLFP